MTLESQPLCVTRLPGEFSSDDTRVITRFWLAGDDARMRLMVERVLALSEEATRSLLDEVIRDYGHRHRDFVTTLTRRFHQHLAHLVADRDALSRERQLLLAAYFTKEYSVESAALFNPSIIAHPNQENLPRGEMRFIMSFRATGEGHISSIVFRSGIIRSDSTVVFDPVSPYIETTEVLKDALYNKHLFELKLNEMHVPNEVTALMFERLPEAFTYDQLVEEMHKVEEENHFAEIVQTQTFSIMQWLALSNYELRFHEDRQVSERVIFPASPSETNGIEDARFVRFQEDDGSHTYHATYTAYNGMQILPMLITTTDFTHFRIVTLNGKMVQNKGMALFPRKINGKYAMISRQDGVNLYLMYSDHLHFWQEAQVIKGPEYPWEISQIGNCGSPLETEAGWLLLTHGVGAMRKYSIGVALLDKDDPSRVLSYLREPLLAPNEYEREGYTPNVVYTCGAVIHQNQLIIPYAMSDSRCAIASVPVPELLAQLAHDAV